MERYRNTSGIIIKIKTVKESDLLVTLLTSDMGKINVLAKGAKNIKSKRLGSLQLGNTVKIHLYQKNEFLWLSEISTITQFLRDKKNLTQLNLLFYFLEILNEIVADNQHLEGIFPIVSNLIQSINDNHFEKFIQNEIAFIQILGFGLPDKITVLYQQKKYTDCQQLIKHHLESIIEKPLHSNKLFS